MKTCPNCKKQYKIEKCFQKHLLLCNISKENADKCISLPTKKEMWIIIQQQNKSITTLLKRVEVLEKSVNKDVKKINIIEWLSNNIIPDIDINLWIKNLKIKIEIMYLIWRTTFENGLEVILENSIMQKGILPFKAFNHKNKELFIYNSKKWEKCSTKVLKKIFDKIQTELIRRHLEFDKEKGTMKKAPTTDYLKNYDKIVITDDKKKNIYYKKIQQILINNFKINMNELIQFQFNI